MNKYKKKESISIENSKKKSFTYYTCNYFFFLYLDYIYTAVCSLSASVRNSWLVASPSLESHGVFVILNSDRTLVLWDAGTSVEVVEGSSTKPKKKYLLHFVTSTYLKTIISFIKNQISNCLISTGFFLSNINTHELTPSARYTDFLCGDDWRIVVVGYGVAAVFAALGIDEMNTVI